MKKIAILQSNYIPWKGVFDMINQVDAFVFFEDVQFTKRDWRSRNKIKTPSGEIWLSIPTRKTSRDTMIHEVEINNEINWQKNHFESFKHNYSKAPYFREFKWILEDIYLDSKWKSLSEFNIYTTKLISSVLGIKTTFINSKDLSERGSKDDKLIQICKSLNANVYLSGPAAKNYINNEKFREASIKLEYIQYEYPTYHQRFEPFSHYVSILDLIFNVGNNAPNYIWGWREEKHEFYSI